MQPSWHHKAVYVGAALAIAAASEEEGSRCGTWCEDNGFLADGCNCGVCGSYGDCRQLQCPHRHPWCALDIFGALVDIPGRLIGILRAL